MNNQQVDCFANARNDETQAARNDAIPVIAREARPKPVIARAQPEATEETQPKPVIARAQPEATEENSEQLTQVDCFAVNGSQ
ncbi:MAG: hypothetical protein LBN27_11520 [Prevotellaceae bacterium]|nr:hypothetical protein [Prevotellaceae bacterium]